MKLSIGVVLALLTSLAVAGKGKRKPPTSLRIGVMHKPESCPLESHDGDMLYM